MTKKKYAVTVHINQADGYQVYGIEAESEEEARNNWYNGDIIFEEYETGWDKGYGSEPEPEVEEVSEFDYGCDQRATHDLKTANEKIKILEKRIDDLIKESGIVEMRAQSLMVANLYNIPERLGALEQAIVHQRRVLRGD